MLKGMFRLFVHMIDFVVANSSIYSVFINHYQILCWHILEKKYSSSPA